MPIYEYYCRSCDHEWEREQRISDAPVKTCPSCRARQAKRMISRTSFVLKGGGWYSDLYSSSTDKKDESKSESTAESSASEKSSDKPSKDSSSKDSGSKDAGSKDAGSKGSGSKSKKKGSKAA